MKKKNYVKPSMEVVKLQHQAQLLDGSFGGGDEPSSPSLYQVDMRE